MCAIFGILGEYSSTQAKSALSLMSHRGPDYCGIIEENNCFFAHNRLSIMDTSSNAHQPLKHKQILLSFNGEIFNFKALKEQLNFNFKSESDSEVLIAAYLKWGVDFVQHLSGMFAIALKDGDDLYLFRDRLGKKPLYFLAQNSRFIFASEIKALKPFLSSIEMNKDALSSYLSYLAPTPPHTFYKGIEKLESAHYLHVKNFKTTLHHYYSPLHVTPSLHTNLVEVTRSLDEHLHQAIAQRLHADTPMASLLSGGIDSALIAAIAKEHNTNLPTFTLGYKEFSNYDERVNASITAKELGVKNTPIEINQDDYIGAIDKVFDAMDEPINDPASIPLYLLFEAIKKEGYKVILSGEGSDELFLGYRQYFEYLDIEKASSLLHKNWLKKYFRSNFSMNREWEWYKRIFEDKLLFRSSGEKFTDLQKNLLLRQNVKDGDSLKYLEPYQKRFEESLHVDNASWYSYIDLSLFQAEHFLTKLDRVSMAHSIESRTPFLDHNLVDYVFEIEPSLKYNQGKPKALLKEVAKKYLSDEILGRKKKGFSNPYMEYLIASGRIDLITKVNNEVGMFNKDILERYIGRAKAGRFKQHVWGLYVLSHWIDKNLL